MADLGNLTARPASPEDLTFLRRCFLEARPELQFLPEALVDMQWRAREMGYKANFPNAELVIVEQNGEPAATYWFQEGEESDLIDLTVLAHLRDQGIGTWIIRRLKSAGKPIHLSVKVDNPARRLYEREGFVVNGAEDDQAFLSMTWLKPYQQT